MSKELEAFENIMRIYGETNSLEGTYDDFLAIKKALQRLEAIDNAIPSEALECLKDIDDHLKHIDIYYYKNGCDKDINIIKQALIKAQEQEKVLEIIKEKRVDLPYLRCCFEDNQSVERYNEYIRNKTMDYDHEQELTQEEFELIKRWAGEND